MFHLFHIILTKPNKSTTQNISLNEARTKVCIFVSLKIALLNHLKLVLYIGIKKSVQWKSLWSHC